MTYRYKKGDLIWYTSDYSKMESGLYEIGGKALPEREQPYYYVRMRNLNTICIPEGGIRPSTVAEQILYASKKIKFDL